MMLYTTFNVLFEGYDEPDSLLLMRYFQCQSVFSVPLSGRRDELQVSGGRSQISSAMSAFELEFGLQVSKTWPPVVKRHKSPMITVTATKLDSVRSWEVFAANSLILRAYSDLVHNGSAKAGAALVSCRYWIRPWLTKDCRRIETVEGTFRVRLGKQTEDIAFCFDP